MKASNYFEETLNEINTLLEKVYNDIKNWEKDCYVISIPDDVVRYCISEYLKNSGFNVISSFSSKMVCVDINK